MGGPRLSGILEAQTSTPGVANRSPRVACRWPASGRLRHTAHTADTRRAPPPPMCILIKSMYEGAACALLVMGPQGLEEYRERPRVQPIPPQTGAKSRA